MPISRRAFITLSLTPALAALSGCAESDGASAGPAPAEGSADSPVPEGPDFRNADLGIDIPYTGSVPLSCARNFTIDEFEGGMLLICVSNGERFLIVPDRSEAPEGLADNISVIQQPIRSTYLVSTGMICLIDEIGALDAITVSSVTADDSPNENLARAIDDGTVSYGGKYSAPDFELIAKRACTLAIENTKINHAPDIKQKLVGLGVAVITEQSSSEPEVLGRLEWIKLMGALFDRQDEARESFERIAERVEDVASQKPTGKTVAFFYINDDGAAVTRRSTDYFAQMIELAGGTLVSFDPTEESEESSSVQAVIDLETFYARAKEADVIIYNTTVDASVASIADLTAKNGLLADFRAVRAGAVFACDEDMYQAMTSMDLIIGDIRSALTDADESSGYIWRLV